MAPKRDRVLNDSRGYPHGLTNNPIFLLHGSLAAIIAILIAASTAQAQSTLTIAVGADRQHGGFADGKPAARLGGDALADRHHRAPINGACGSANGVAVNSAPTSGLCSAGTASSVSGSGPWDWSCAGSNGGSTAMCMAPLQQSGGGVGGSGLLPPDRDASANWQMAGMLSVGGIPNRTTVCATVSPLGSGQDDTADIQNAINACPLGQVVSLSAGTFTIAEGNYVLLNKGITLRGAGAGVTTLQRTDGAQLGNYAPGSNPSPMIIVGPQRYGNAETATTLTADGAQGAYSVQVASTAGFSVGQIVLLDEASGAGWQPDVVWTNMQIWAAPDYRVVWQKHNPYYQYVDDFDASTYPYTSGSAG